MRPESTREIVVGNLGEPLPLVFSESHRHHEASPAKPDVVDSHGCRRAFLFSHRRLAPVLDPPVDSAFAPPDKPTDPDHSRQFAAVVHGPNAADTASQKRRDVIDDIKRRLNGTFQFWSGDDGGCNRHEDALTLWDKRRISIRRPHHTLWAIAAELVARISGAELPSDARRIACIQGNATRKFFRF
jgi:hypothetical protein